MVESVGRVASCVDNAALISFFSRPQMNVLNRRSWTTLNELRIAIMTRIESTRHRRRRQSRPSRLTPIEFEAIMNTPAALAA
jgi:putative transposase